MIPGTINKIMKDGRILNALSSAKTKTEMVNILMSPRFTKFLVTYTHCSTMSVEVDEEGSNVFFNSDKNTICIGLQHDMLAVPLEEEDMEGFASRLLALIAHEAGHFHYSPQIKNAQVARLRKALIANNNLWIPSDKWLYRMLNIVEDARIEAAIHRVWPGSLISAVVDECRQHMVKEMLASVEQISSSLAVGFSDSGAGTPAPPELRFHPLAIDETALLIALFGWEKIAMTGEHESLFRTFSRGGFGYRPPRTRYRPSMMAEYVHSNLHRLYVHSSKGYVKQSDLCRDLHASPIVWMPPIGEGSELTELMEGFDLLAHDVDECVKAVEDGVTHHPFYQAMLTMFSRTKPEEEEEEEGEDKGEEDSGGDGDGDGDGSGASDGDGEEGEDDGAPRPIYEGGDVSDAPINSAKIGEQYENELLEDAVREKADGSVGELPLIRDVRVSVEDAVKADILSSIWDRGSRPSRPHSLREVVAEAEDQAKKDARKLLPIVKYEQRTHYEKGLTMGKFDFSRSDEIDVTWKCFKKKNIPFQRPSIAIMVRIDLSGSMSSVDKEEFIVHTAAYYNTLSKETEIPICIIGDSSELCGLRHLSLYKGEHVSIHTYYNGRFVIKEWDGSTTPDTYKYLGGLSQNHDGFSHLYNLKELCMRPEQTLVYINASDGDPCGSNYSGGAGMRHTGATCEMFEKAVSIIHCGVGLGEKDLTNVYGERADCIAEPDSSNLPGLSARIATRIVNAIKHS